MFSRFEPWLRWLPMLLALWIAGQFLEGPPYREIVRSGVFIVMVCSITLLAADAFFRYHLYPFFIAAVYSLVTAGGFLWALQHYYNGGKNPHYYWSLCFWSLLFTINIVVYLNGLTAPWRKGHRGIPAELCGRRKMASYQLHLYAKRQDGSRGGLRHQAEGTHPFPEAIVLAGYSQDQIIDLTPYWEQIRLQQLTIFNTEVSVYETIIKFGEAMQLIDLYELEIQVSYAGPLSEPLE